jgi:hypothetical protein
MSDVLIGASGGDLRSYLARPAAGRGLASWSCTMPSA